MGGPDFEAIPPHTERAALKRLIVAAIGLCHQIGHDLTLIVHLADKQILRHRRIGFDRPDAIDTGHRGHDDHIVPFQQRPRCRVAHAVNLFVDLAFFFDIGVRPRHVCLGLIIIIVGHEVFDRIVRKEPFEFTIQLRRQCFVGRKDDRRSLSFLDHLGHGECLARAGRAQQNLILFPAQHTSRQLLDRGGLVACRLKGCVHDKPFAAF